MGATYIFLQSKLRVRTVLLAACMATLLINLMSVVFPYMTAEAISNRGPDSAISASNPRYSLVVSPNTGDMGTIQVPIYLPSAPTGAVSISIRDFVCFGGGTCTGTGSSNQYVEVRQNNGAGFLYGRYRGTSAFSIPASAFSVNPATGYYRANLNLQLRNGNNLNGPSSFYNNAVSFRLYASGNALVGSSVGGSASFVSFSANDVSNGGPYTYTIPFATPCAISAATNGRITLFDVDSGTADNQFRDVTVNIRDANTNAIIGTTQSGSLGGNTEYYIDMSFRPNGRYKLELTNVASINYVQFKFPYDDINYRLGCTNLYGLTPSITTSPSPRVYQGSTVTTQPSVTSSGVPGNHAWKVVSATYAPGVTPNFAPTNTDDGCASYNGESSCNSSFQSGTNSFNTASTPLPQGAFNVSPITPVNTTICFALYVNKPTTISAATEWRYSSSACVVVVPPPDISTVQLWGYDSILGGKAITSTKQIGTVDRKTYGSWSEYGILSKGPNINFASAAGLNGGNASTTQSSWSRLTFANTAIPASPACGSSYGCAGNVSYPTDLVAKLKARCTYGATNISTSSLGLTNVNNVRYVCAHGTVTVDSNITLSDSPVSDASRLPQVIIIANDIVIKKTVDHVDAWLIASKEATAPAGGRISTCSEATNPEGSFVAFASLSTSARPITKTTCPTPLTATGPVIADKLYLYRTTPVTAAGEYGERFNLRADAFLWAYSGGGGSTTPVAQTTYVKELPPRF